MDDACAVRAGQRAGHPHQLDAPVHHDGLRRVPLRLARRGSPPCCARRSAATSARSPGTRTRARSRCTAPAPRGSSVTSVIAAPDVPADGCSPPPTTRRGTASSAVPCRPRRSGTGPRGRSRSPTGEQGERVARCCPPGRRPPSTSCARSVLRLRGRGRGAGAALRRGRAGTPPRPPTARYHREGFEAAAVTAVAVRMSFRPPRRGRQREAVLRFDRPYAVVATATGGRGPVGPAAGLLGVGGRAGRRRRAAERANGAETAGDETEQGAHARKDRPRSGMPSGAGSHLRGHALRVVSQSQPCSSARRTASARVRAVVLPIAADRWLRTVPSDRCSRAATSRPWPRRRRRAARRARGR